MRIRKPALLPMGLIAIITTLPNREQARELATHLVEQGLVACAQLGEIESIYRWDNDLQQGPEIRLLLKTRQDLYSAVEAIILERHSYDLPAIHSLRIDQVHPPYRDWIENSLRSS